MNAGAVTYFVSDRGRTFLWRASCLLSARNVTDDAPRVPCVWTLVLHVQRDDKNTIIDSNSAWYRKIVPSLQDEAWAKQDELLLSDMTSWMFNISSSLSHTAFCIIVTHIPYVFTPFPSNIFLNTSVTKSINTLNTYPPSAANMRQWIGSALVQIMPII